VLLPIRPRTHWRQNRIQLCRQCVRGLSSPLCMCSFRVLADKRDMMISSLTDWLQNFGGTAYSHSDKLNRFWCRSDFEYWSGSFLPRDALQCKARSCDRMSSVCLPSVMLMDCDDVGWNSSKIMSRLVSLGCSLFADPSMMGLLQGEHPEILAPEWEWGAEKWFLAYKSFNISETRQDRTKVTFVTNEDESEVLNVLSMVPTSMTLDDFEGLLCCPFA